MKILINKEKNKETTSYLKGLSEISKAYRLTAMYAFGSRSEEIASAVSKGETLFSSGSSDVDIALLPKAAVKLSLRQKVRISIEMEKLFGVSTCDVIALPESDPFLAAQVIRGERIYCCDTFRADEYELYVLRRAGDLIPLEKERIALIMGKRQ